MNRWLRPSLLLLGLAAAAAAHAVEVRFERVVEGVYAFIGETRRPHLRQRGAERQHRPDRHAWRRGADRQRRDCPERRADPRRREARDGPAGALGDQHRRPGPSLARQRYFKEQGAQLIAHANGRADMMNRGNDHLQALRPVLKERLEGTVPVLPDRYVEGSDIRLELGGTVFELRHRGGAHTPGDMMVWLPAACCSRETWCTSSACSACCR
jgi:hypothetical protein